MKIVVNDPKYGEIIYNEILLINHKSVIINRRELPRVSDTAFLYNGVHTRLRGNRFFGLRLLIGSDVIEFVPTMSKAGRLATLLALLPIVFLLIWGNIPSLCAIFPVVGGLIGFLIGLLFSSLSTLFIFKAKKTVFKIIIGISCFIASIATACFFDWLFLIILYYIDFFLL